MTEQRMGPTGRDLAGWVKWMEPMDPVTRLLAELDYWSYEVYAVGAGTVRRWKFDEWQGSLQRAVDAVREVNRVTAP